MLHFWRKYFLSMIIVATIIGFVIIASTITIYALNADSVIAQRPLDAVPVPTPADKPVFSAYKGVSIGKTADEARRLLGKPSDQSETQDQYIFSDNESAQVYYDAAHLVTAISIMYSGDLTAAPTPKDIFGEAAQPKPDGGIFKMMRYPKAGFWISYSRTAGDGPIISIAMQKI